MNDSRQTDLPRALQLGHIGALERAAQLLDIQADELMRLGDYDAMFPEGDAKALREIAAVLKACGTITDPKPDIIDTDLLSRAGSWNACEQIDVAARCRHAEGMLALEFSRDGNPFG